MLASFITARARLQLVDMLEKLERCGCSPIYTDTDSVYFTTNNFDTQACQDLVTKEVDGLILGKWKLEMSDNVGEETAIGAFACLKTYALKSEAMNKTKVKAKGVAEWLIKTDKKSHMRREQN